MTDDLSRVSKGKSPANAVPSENPTSIADPMTQQACDTMPCGHKTSGRNLIVCIDGTANKFGKKNTNVIELYNLLSKGTKDRQRTWYNSGIGTSPQPYDWKSPSYYVRALVDNLDSALVLHFKRTILGAYRWLSDNYEEGDCIFLFGFSRGAFQVRVLAAMIDKVGLICRGNEMQIPFAYEVYADPKSGERGTQVGAQGETSMAAGFKSAFSYENVKVHFVGAWDTVSSIGIARGSLMLPGTIDGMKHLCYFRHALALDERRVKFLPEYTYGGSTKPPTTTKDKNIARADNEFPTDKPRVENDTTDSECRQVGGKSESMRQLPQTLEVWFPGTHSDVGGGNVENAGMDRSRPPLRWMVFEAEAVGLRMAPFKRDLSSKEQINVTESLTNFWWLFELLPFRRLTFTRREDGKYTTRKPHLGSRRKIHDGQKIHSSFLLGDRSGPEKYTPKARPPNHGIEEAFWDMLRTEGLTGESSRIWLELDLYESANSIVEQAMMGNATDAMRKLATSAEGRRALYSAVVNVLRRDVDPDSVEALCELLRCAVKLIANRPLMDLIPLSKIRPSVSCIWKSENEKYREVVRDFVLWFTDPCFHVSLEHQEPVASVAFSPGGRRVASCSWDRTVRIWDAETGKPVGEPLRGHNGWVRSVAFSPDGKRVVSGSTDKTIRIWDAETRAPVGEPLHGHTDEVLFVAFSPDGKCVVSGSSDMTARIWDAETRAQMGDPLRGHTDLVLSVAFSPDSKRVASGSFDKTVRIWDAESGEPVGKPLRGHTDWVKSVAFSPDGERVASGSDDKTIRIWDAKTGDSVGEPFQGHTGWVWSVSFSPDGKRVVSGEKTVRIWDVETGKSVGEPLRGHIGPVFSVSFSPDGKRVASGSKDATVRIWDVEIWVARP